VDSPRLITRIVAAGLPLLLIGLVFGAAGYALEEPESTPIPPLAAQEPPEAGTRGEITNVSGDQFTLVRDDGSTLSFRLAGDAPVEALEPISLDEVSLGDWLNGGAIPHPQTVLALINLILVTDPETP
jgi:hypothetical protein